MIFDYRSRFLTKIFDISRGFLCAEQESGVIFSPRGKIRLFIGLRNMVKNGLQKQTFFGILPSYGYLPSRGQKFSKSAEIWYPGVYRHRKHESERIFQFWPFLTNIQFWQIFQNWRIFQLLNKRKYIFKKLICKNLIF